MKESETTMTSLWKEDAELFTFVRRELFTALVQQLAVGGRMVIPVGRYFQELVLLEKQQDGTVRRKAVAPVRFVPMTGEAQKRSKQ